MQKKHFTLGELAKILQGTVCGKSDTIICGVKSIKAAQSNDLSLLYNKKYVHEVKSSKAGAYLVNAELAHLVENAIVLDNPRLALCKVLSLFAEQETLIQDGRNYAYIAKTAQVSDKAVIYPFVSILPGAVVGENSILYSGVSVGENCVIGKDCVLHANVVVERDCVIQDKVIIHANTTIGSDGFGFVIEQGKSHKIPHLKKVQIDQEVEIGANCSIDRGSMQDTWIKAGSKLDNLIQIGHNCHIGENSIICAQSGLAGSVVLGEGAVLSGKAGIADNLTIAAKTVVGPSSVLTRSLKKPGQVYYGYPAKPKDEWVKGIFLINKLESMQATIKQLEEKVAKLTE